MGGATASSSAVLLPSLPAAGHGQSVITLGIYTLQLVLGGYNATHYLVDAWLRVGRTALQETDAVPSDYEWHRLSAAPFSPRADVQLKLVSRSNSAGSAAWLIVGGQTAHQCELRELGVCSDQVWRLAVVLSGPVYMPSVTATWSPQPIARLPTTHCGAAVRFNLNLTRLFGGQHSYDDSSCSSAPLYSNEVWTSMGALAGWSRDPLPFPFSPRRFFPAHDDWDATTSGFRYQTIPLIAGAVISGVRPASPSTAARVTGVVLLADVWACSSLGWPQNISSLCTWTSQLSIAPMAGGQSDLAKHFGGNSVDNFLPSADWTGGYTSRAFLEQYRTTLPVLAAGIDTNLAELAVNLTMVKALVYGDIERWHQRTDLPDNTTLGEEEVNDPLGDYLQGGAWQQWSVAFARRVHVGLYYTLHYQPTALADDPEHASFYLPQAASSLNTSRPALNLPLRRLDGRSTHHSPQPVVVSGGHSGATYYNDVIEYLYAPDMLYGSPISTICWPGDDPSFRAALGPVEWTSRVWHGPGATLPNLALARCAQGHHWEPTVLGEEVILTCMPNRMWMDDEALTIRRCVRDTLNCSFPLRDLGGVQCQPMLPVIDGLHASYLGEDGTVQFLDEENAWTLVNAPLLGGVQLTVVGLVFLEPVRVEVGGVPCESAELVEPGLSSPLPSVCYNVTESGDGEGPSVTLCSRYASSIVCSVGVVVGTGLEVQVTTGRMGAVSSMSELAWQHDIHTATLATMAPQLQSVTAADCHQDDSQRLSSCPITSTFNVTVCASAHSIGLDPELGDDVSVVIRSKGSQLLACSPWRSEDLLRAPTAQSSRGCRPFPSRCTVDAGSRRAPAALPSPTEHAERERATTPLPCSEATSANSAPTAPQAGPPTTSAARTSAWSARPATSRSRPALRLACPVRPATSPPRTTAAAALAVR